MSTPCILGCTQFSYLCSISVQQKRCSSSQGTLKFYSYACMGDKAPLPPWVPVCSMPEHPASVNLLILPELAYRALHGFQLSQVSGLQVPMAPTSAQSQTPVLVVFTILGTCFHCNLVCGHNTCACFSEENIPRISAVERETGQSSQLQRLCRAPPAAKYSKLLSQTLIVLSLPENFFALCSVFLPAHSASSPQGSGDALSCL